MEIKKLLISLAAFSLTLSGCTYNPFLTKKQTTGNPTATLFGAAASAGAVAALGAPKPLIIAAGIGGGAVGYYLSTQRHAAAAIIEAGGQVYQVGYYVGINLPSDQLFEVNTADFLPEAPVILDSVVAVLQRYPDNNILISGNTSGFARTRWENKLSKARAKKVADYLWSAGINHFKNPGITTRHLTYVGYGNYFPIANDLTNDGIRENSRIQISSYPSDADLQLDQRHLAVHNVGALEDDIGKSSPKKTCGYKGDCYK